MRTGTGSRRKNVCRILKSTGHRCFSLGNKRWENRLAVGNRSAGNKGKRETRRNKETRKNKRWENKGKQRKTACGETKENRGNRSAGNKGKQACGRKQIRGKQGKQMKGKQRYGGKPRWDYENSATAGNRYENSATKVRKTTVGNSYENSSLLRWFGKHEKGNLIFHWPLTAIT